MSIDPLIPETLVDVPVAAYHEKLLSGVGAVLRRRWRFLANSVALGAVLGTAFLVLAPRQYAAEALVQLDLGRVEGAATVGTPPPAVALDAANILQGEVRIIRSRLIVRRVVRDQHLAGTASASATEQAIERVMSHLTVRTDNRSYLISIGYSAASPEQAAGIANAVAAAYLRFRADENTSAAADRARWLAAEIQAGKVKLQEQEAGIAAFRAKSGLTDTGGSGELQQRMLTDALGQLSNAGLDTLKAEGRFERIKASVKAGRVPSADDLAATPALTQLIERQAAARRALAALLARLGPKHPDAIAAQASVEAANAAVAAEESRAVELAGQAVQAAQLAQRNLQARVDNLRQQLIAVRARQSELRNLEAQAQVTREWVTALATRYDQESAQKSLRAVNARLTVPAEPVPSPTFPKPMVVLALGLLGGAGIGFGGIAITEQLDRGFRTGPEVEAATGVRYMGAVPNGIGCGQSRSPRSAPDFDEPVRTACAGLGLFDSRRECRLVSVTSALPGEGKSELCHAIAETLTRAGQRVLLIDGYTSGEASYQGDWSGTPSRDLIPVDTERRPGALMLARGNCPGAAPDVLMFHRFDQFLDAACKEFDTVIIETAPVLMFGEAMVIGRRADVVVHAAAWAATPKKVIASSIARLRAHNVQVDGVILTRVDPDRYAQFTPMDECFFYVRHRDVYERELRRRAVLHAQSEEEPTV